MIIKISDNNINEKMGNKAKNLQILSNNNFNVPNGIIISNDILQNVDNYISETVSMIDENKSYAVRSSGIKEDLDNLSFAGLYNTYLNVKGKENIIQS
ncbi:MAG: hypothetical protein IJO27_01815, partial [Bacilli bacterium]|nr:hypothetical protein [Bacilli bacterium]